MFDWNDEALANIIWGEAGESGDHIVPYPNTRKEDGHKKFQNQEFLVNKPAEHKLLDAKLYFQGIRPESSSVSNKNGQISASSTPSWPDMAASEVAETGHNSLNDEMLGDSVLVSKYLTKDECQVDGDSEAYINLLGKELPDFGEYGWENIGSFDDLDRIFSNDEHVFPFATLRNPEEISSSKEKKKSYPKSFDSPTGDSKSCLESLEAVQVKPKHRQGGQSIDISFETMHDSSSLTFQQKSELGDIVGHGENKRKHNLALEVNTRPASSHLAAESILSFNDFADKVYGQESRLKIQKKIRGKAKGKLSQHFISGCSVPTNTPGFYNHQLSTSLPQACPPSSTCQLDQAEGPVTFNYPLMPHSCVNSAFSNHANPIATVKTSLSYQPGELECQTVFPSYEVTSTDVDSAGNQLDSPGKAPSMTPREKIEKLKLRQQMQAVLAIQNQLQQFGSQVTRSAITQNNNPLESLSLLRPRLSYEANCLRALPSLDVASTDQDESSTLSAAVDGYSIEDGMLQQLQHMIFKMDVPVRISIRDSLFRLATSALQRQKTTDIDGFSARKRDQYGALVKEEHDNGKREVTVADSETETNPIDRAVAHLLFHRPLSGKHLEAQESSVSAKLSREQEVYSGADQAADSGRSDSFDISSHGFGNPCCQPLDCMVASHPSPDYSVLAAGAPEHGSSLRF